MHTIPFSIVTVFNEPALNMRGNPCAVVLLEDAWTDPLMQEVAADLNQPATTFLWKADSPDSYHVRWFAPDEEIALCGHGTLAAVAWLSEQFGVKGTITLQHRSGQVSGRRISARDCSMVFPSVPVDKELPVPALLPEALGIPVIAYYSTSNKDIVIVENEQELKRMKPDFAKLRQLKTFGYLVTALGDEVDYVNRTLIPHVQQLEDHATGSAHAVLAPFWSDRLNKNMFVAHQLSPRGGKFTCELKDTNTHMTGQFQVLAQGTLNR